MSDTYVLDAFALMAYLRDEPGAERVRQLLQAASLGTVKLYLSLVNYGEVIYTSERLGGQTAAEFAILTVDSLPIEVVAANRSMTFAAAHLKAQHRLSFADAFAAALALATEAVLVTGDPEFHALHDQVAIEWLQQRDPKA